MFIALNQEKANLLKDGITTYLQNKFNQSITSIYLDDKYRGGKSSSGTSEYFLKIIKNKDYNLLDDANKQQIMSYLSDNYLPGLIYKNKNTSVEKPVMIKSKDLILEQSDLNFSLDGMKIPDGLKSQITFLNFFGVNDQTQIKEAHIKEIKTEHFLKDVKIYEGKYYSLGSGSLEINDWSIKGFPINQIIVKFNIYIRKEILDTEVSDLKIALRNVLEIMKTSRVNKLVGTAANAEGKYALQIDSGNNQRRGKTNLGGEVTFDNILNTLYTEPAKERAKGNFGPNINNVSFKFFTGNDHLRFTTTDNFKYSIVGRNTRQNEPLNIYFMFNTSFKIKLNDGLLVERTKNTTDDDANKTNNQDNNHRFYIR